MMNKLEQLQQQIDILKANCDALHDHVEKVAKSINELKSSDSSSDTSSDIIEEPVHWVDYIFPPGSHLLRYKCSNCGYISTFKTLSCARCKEYIGG